jgi:hypothetical protein
MDHMNPKSPKALIREMTEVRPGRTSPSNLRDQVYWGRTYAEAKETWPTPSASDDRNRGTLNSLSIQRRMASGKQLMLSMVVSDRRPMLQENWPTPSVRDWKGGYIGGRIRNGRYSWDALDIAVQYTDNQSKMRGFLSPSWVEWLMHFPIGWTSIEPLAVTGGLPSLLSADYPLEQKTEQDDCED